MVPERSTLRGAVVKLTSMAELSAGATTAKVGAAGPATMRAALRATVAHSVTVTCVARWRGLDTRKNLIGLFKVGRR